MQKGRADLQQGKAGEKGMARPGRLRERSSTVQPIWLIWAATWRSGARSMSVTDHQSHLEHPVRRFIPEAPASCFWLAAVQQQCASGRFWSRVRTDHGAAGAGTAVDKPRASKGKLVSAQRPACQDLQLPWLWGWTACLTELLPQCLMT